MHPDNPAAQTAQDGMESLRARLRPIDELAHATTEVRHAEGTQGHPALRVPLWRTAPILDARPVKRAGEALSGEAARSHPAQGKGIGGRHGTTPGHRRSCGMKRLALGTKVASIRQKLAAAIALLAAVMFVMHAAAAKGTGSYLHDHHLPYAGALLVMGDGAHEPGHRHEHPRAAGHMHGSADKGSPPCCGDACLAALVPDEDPPLGDPWGMPSRCSVTALSLTGHDPERLRRPPRLFHAA